MVRLDFSRSRARIFPLAAAAALAAATTVSGRTFTFDLRPPTASPRAMASAAPSPARDGVLRSFRLDAGRAATDAPTVGDTLVFSLFDDVTIEARLRQKMPSPLCGEAFLAEVTGNEGMKTAVVLSTPDGITLDAQDFRTGRVYKVLSSQSGVKVMELQPSVGGECGCEAFAPTVPETPVVRSAGLLRAASRNDACIDILVAYDKGAADFAEANGGLTNFAQIAVQKINAALANTGLGEKFHVRLVGVCSIQASETDLTAALYALLNDQPEWKEVKAAREAVGADIVSTLIDTGSAHGKIGVGWQLTSNFSIPAFGSTYAYNVCSVRSVMEANTMTHECGHNLGAGHSDVQYSQPGPQLYRYSSGYFFSAGGRSYGTIMAYEQQNPSGEPTSEVPFFSSPLFQYEGVPVGDDAHDNTRTIANTFSYAANWMPRKVPLTVDIEFVPPDCTLIDPSLDVTLVPGVPGAEIRYTLDGSDPTSVSPLYTGPIHLSESAKIKASIVLDGVVSPPFTAAYPTRRDAGFALRLLGDEWQYYGNLPGSFKGETYNGYARDGDGGIAGTFVLTVKKPFKKKNEAPAKLTFTSLATGKKTKMEGGVNLSTGEGNGSLAGLSFGEDAVGGALAGTGVLEGGADAVKSKNADALAVQARFKGRRYVLVLAPEDPEQAAQAGYSTLAISFSAKGKAKVSGVLADGTRVNASAQMTVGDVYCAVPAILSKKNTFGFVAWFDKETRELAGTTCLTPWTKNVKPVFTTPWRVAARGGKGKLEAGARTFELDGERLSALVEAAIGQTPRTVPLTVKGTRWITEKPSKVSYRNGTLSISGGNVSGLKLRYTSKTGLFSGSFTVYSVKGGKLSKNRFTVAGSVTGGIGYGTAVLKGKGSAPVEIK